jgi:hypothetical protein
VIIYHTAMLSKNIVRIIAAAAFFFAAACTPGMCQQAGSGDGQSSPKLEICLHNHLGGYGYTYAELLERSRSDENTPCVAAISESDIVKYRVSEKPSGRVELLLTAQASSRIARKREGMYKDVCEEGLFTVTLNGKSLFRGQCYTWMGAAALRYPVMHIDLKDDGTVALRIGAQQGQWMGMQATDGAAIERIDPPELRELFKKLGKLEILK